MTYITTNIIKRTKQKHFLFLFAMCLVALFFSAYALSARAAEIERYTGGVLVYADNTVGVPKYKIFTDGTGFGAEQSAAQVGTTTIEWVRVAASPTVNEWIIVTRDAADRIVAQVCVGINDGLSCGATTTISATAGTHGLRNFDVAYEQTSGDALLVYGTATADQLRKIEYSGGVWSGDASITTTRTSGTIEWVELTSRGASNEIGVAYSDSNDDVSAYRWSGTAIGNEATAAITATAATTDVRKFDISFEGVSGDMIVAAPLAAAGTTALGHMTSAGTWTIVANTEPDNITAFIDLQEPNPIDNEVAMVAHGTATTSNPSEGYALNGATPNTTTTGMVDGTVAVDTTSTVWAANYMMASVAYQSSTYYAVGVFSDVTGADDINWWTMASTSVWTARTDNTRTRGTIRFTDLFDYPNADKVLLLSSDANSDLWADTWNGATTSATAWTDLTSGGALELTLSSATTDVYDFAFRISPPALSGVLYSDQGVTNAGAGKTINIRVGTSTPSTLSTVTTSGGVWEFPSHVFTNATSGTPFVIWLDEDAEDATTLFSGYTGSFVAGVPLYYEHVIAHGATTSSQVHAEAFGFYDSSDDLDIRFSYDSSLFSVFGNFLINQGEFIAPALFLGDGPFVNRGVFNANNGLVNLHGAGTVDGILTGTSSFNILQFDSGAVYTIATTSASTSVLAISADSLVTASSNVSVARLYLNSGTFTHGTGTFYAGSALQEFVFGVDVTGDSESSTGAGNANGAIQYGSYLYVVTNGNAAACSQNVGEAIGCELQVYDISDGSGSTMSYIAGRDSAGSPTGTEGETMAAVAIKDTYLYVSKETSVDECNPVINLAYGCELLIFDISNPANPTFVTAIDDDGSVYGDGINVFLSLEIEGNYLYTTKYNNSIACSQTPGNAEGCELQVWDISSSTNPIYVAGRDVEGSSNGTGYRTVWSSTIEGNSWFTVMSGGDTACSDTPGSGAQSCELQIYDISNPTNPTYIAGMDASGDPTGATGNIFYDVAVSGNTLYVAANGAQYDCDTNYYSCELHVYDITDRSNPTFITGRDASGVFGNTVIGAFVTVHAEAGYLYVFKTGDAAACSQIVGSANGCEIQVYDISSSTNPIYVSGRDADGSRTGTDARDVVRGYVGERSLFAAMAASSTNCSATGDASGCEVLAFQRIATAGGDMTGENAFNDFVVTGSGVLFDESVNNGSAEVRNLTINSGELLAPAGDLIVGGNYNNRATLTAREGTLVLAGTGSTASGTMTGTSAFNNLEVSGSVTFTGAASTTNFLVLDTATATAPATTLSVTNGNFANYGTFNHNNGTLAVLNTHTEAFQFLAGRDASGNADGTGSRPVLALASAGDYLYVGQLGSNASCSQTPGSATPCELLVYNVANPNNPTLVAARDSDGAAAGGGYLSQAYTAFATKGNYLFAGKVGNSEACSQTAGSAVGCEIQVYDISSSTNPVYRAGRDTSGSASGATGDLFAGGGVTSVQISGDYLYVAKEGDATACSQVAGSALGCEFMIFDISSSTNPIYVAGRDVDASDSGTQDIDINEIIIQGANLYVAIQSQFLGAPCSQSAGAAAECELQIYNIANPANPVYVAGRDSSGTVDGISGDPMFTLAIHGTTLYVGKGAYEANICVGEPSLNAGCELDVYDISSSTNPVYVTGYDGSGAADGAAEGFAFEVKSLSVSGNNLFVGSNLASSIGCTAVAGKAQGCTLQVYDVSSPNRLSFIFGRAFEGSDSVTSLTVTPEAVFVGKGSNDTACSQVVDATDGCELMVLSTTGPSGLLFGNLAATSTLNDVIASGTIRFLDSATTTDFSVVSGTTTPPLYLTIVGDYTNSGLNNFSGTETVFFSGASAQSISGALRGTSALPQVTFSGVGTKTFSSAASTSDLMVRSGATVVTTHPVEINGDLENAGTFTTDDMLSLYALRNTGSLSLGTYSLVEGNITSTGTLAGGTGEVEINGHLSGVLAGLDYDGSVSGTTTGTVEDSILVGNRLYVAKLGSRSACTQTAGGAIGCELMVFDVSDIENPVFLAARDVSGGASGSNATNGIYTLAVSGNYLYAGLEGNADACSQTPGFAQGCEIQVYDISSSTNPVLVAARDVDGSATGANSAYVYALTIVGNYLYIGTEAEGGVCGQTVGAGYDCGLKVFNISSPTNPVYVAGRDVNGSTGSGGSTAYEAIFELQVANGYLYLAKAYSSTACSQTPGSAEGCELQVWDISSSTNPIFEAGRDIDGSGSGSSSNYESFDGVYIRGDYLYVGHWGNAAVCSQTPGFAQGCELQVYDISDPTDPTYVAGRDSSASEAGTSSTGIITITGIDNYLFVGNFSDSTACSQIPGSAEGCELQVYDISSSTNPVYLAGRDVDGTTKGVGVANINSVKVSGNTLFVAKESTGIDSTCESAFGNCELMIFNRAPQVSGELTNTNAFHNVTVAGAGAHLISSIETNDLFVEASATLIASATIAVAGDLTQNGTFMTNSAESSAWVQQDQPINSFSDFKSVAYGNGLFVAVTGYVGGPVVTSPDGITWTERTAAGDDDVWGAITYGDGLFVAVGFAGGDRVMTSPDGINWTARTAAGDNDEWNSIVYAEDLDLFVAVGQGSGNDRVMTSPDGTNWTVRTGAGSADNWQSVTYGNGLFVAVAIFTGDRVMTSPDGTNWTAQSVLGNWREVTYGNGLFVAVGDSEDRVMTSPNGVSWTVRSAAGNNDNWRSVTYGNGLFVAVGYASDDVVMTSPDGISWTARSAAGDNDDWEAVTYGNGLFVAVGNQAKIMTSQESLPLSLIGTTAQVISGSLTGENHLPSVILQNAGTKTFVDNASTTDFHVLSGAGVVTAPAVLSVFGTLSNEGTLVADDAIYLSGKYDNTATVTAPTTFTFSGGKQRAVGSMTGVNAFTSLVIAGTDRKSFLANASTTNITISPGAEFETSPVFSVAGNYINNGTSTSKGVNWRAISDNLGYNWRGVTYGNGLFVAVGENSGAMTSPDGINWTARSAAGDNDGWQAITYGNGLFVAVADSGNDRVMTSSDGTNWTAHSAAGDNDQWNGVTYGNGLFVAVSDDGDRVMTSSDGTNWTARSATENDDYWFGVTYGNGLFVAVGWLGDDRVMTSPDGTNWTARSAAGDNDAWESVTYGNGLFVAVGFDGDRVMTSPDGTNWTARSAAGNDDGWQSVIYGNGLFVAAGQQDTIMTSPDGIAWTVRTTEGEADNLQSITYGNGLFVAVGVFIGDRVMISDASTIQFSGSGAQSVSGNLSGAHTLGTLSVTNTTGTTTFGSAVAADELLLTAPGATVAFSAGATSTFGTVTITGTEGNEVQLRSTTPDTQFGFAITDTYSITYVDVKDSSGTSTTGVIQATGIDSGNNTNWSFGPGLTLRSAAPYHFYVGQATTTLGEISIAEGETPTITAGNDILLHIDTAVTNFRFNQGTTDFSYGGSAAGKVATGVFYEEDGATVRLDVLSDFSPSDTLIINGVTVGGFTTATSATSRLELHTDDTTSGEPAVLDTQLIRVTGSLSVANHPEDQVENQFSFQNRNDATLYRFSLTGNNEEVTITDLVLTLSGVQNLDTSDLTDFKLYRDTDNDGVLDGGDAQIDGSGVLTINGQYGAVTWSQDFVATSSANYIISADTNTIPLNASAVFGIEANGITSTGDISLYSPVILLSADTIQHIRGGGGAGGANARVGGSSIPGAGTESGGETGGGGAAGEEEDGENIAPDPDFYKPTSTGSPHNEWTNGSNALLSDGTYATAASGGLRQGFSGFNFNIPSGNTIQGIAVKLDASGSTAAGTIDVSVSWDGGNSFTTVKATPTLSGSDVVYMVGGNSDLWGRAWSAGEFSSELFRLRVTSNPSANTVRLDGLEIRVYHQTGGGSSGGGGGGGRS